MLKRIFRRDDVILLHQAPTVTELHLARKSEGIDVAKFCRESRTLGAAARALLPREGACQPGWESITLREAHLAANVPQQSAYRLYQGQDVPPQTAFHRDVLAHLLTDDPIYAFETTQNDVLSYLAGQHDTITSGTPYEMGVIFRG